MWQVSLKDFQSVWHDDLPEYLSYCDQVFTAIGLQLLWRVGGVSEVGVVRSYLFFGLPVRQCVL